MCLYPIQNIVAYIRSQRFSFMLTSKSFIVLDLKLCFMVHLNFYYVIKVKIHSVATM